MLPSSYRSLYGTRFATTASNSYAFDTRPDGYKKASQPISSQGSTGRGTDQGTDHFRHPGRTLESSKTESYLLSLLTDGVAPSLRLKMFSFFFGSQDPWAEDTASAVRRPYSGQIVSQIITVAKIQEYSTFYLGRFQLVFGFNVGVLGYNFVVDN